MSDRKHQQGRREDARANKNRKHVNIDHSFEERPKARPKKQSRYRVLTVITFAVLFVYIAGYLVAFLSRPSASIETVNYGSIDVPEALNGIVIRDEIVVKTDDAGTPSYKFSEHERVKKNAVVCVVRDSDDAGLIEKQIRKIDEDILEVQKSKQDISLFKDDLKRISKNITDSFESASHKISGGNFSEVYVLKDNVQTQIDLRNQIWFTENAKNNSALSGEKAAYENQLDEYSSSYAAPASGVISLRVDNMEEIITPKNMESIVPEQTKMSVKPEYISKVLDIDADSPVFRLVKSNVWYVASYIPNSLAAGFSVGDRVEIYTTADDTEKSANMKVHKLEQGEKQTFIILKSNENMLDFIDIRTMVFRIRQDSYEGFKIPNEAIVEKVFLKIPKECVMESLDEYNVIVRGIDKDTLVPVKISSEDKDYYLVQQDFASIKLGTVLVKGSGVYTISEVSTLKGVYVANSSVAQFTVVDILASNSEYSVVDSEDQYGLKVYDKIVSDAKTVSDDDAVN
ncbi:MAG: hypothetical protein IKU80_01220 [Firmicutes bacterium]|nr:hypothetical protein [Bacillota bacterium]